MRWFKPKHTVCETCKVFFQSDGGRWGNLCHTCRKPVMEKDLRKDAVLKWANNNWEMLEPMYEEDKKKRQEEAKKFSGATTMANLLAQQAFQKSQTQAAQSGCFGHGGIFGR